MTTRQEREAIGEEFVGTVQACPPISSFACADGHGFSCIPDAWPPPADCRQPALFYAFAPMREQEWQIAVKLAEHELRLRGEPFTREDAAHVARAIMLPRREFLISARELANDVMQLKRLHRYTPERVIRKRLRELGAEARLRLVPTRPVQPASLLVVS